MWDIYFYNGYSSRQWNITKLKHIIAIKYNCMFYFRTMTFAVLLSHGMLHTYKTV